MDPQVSEGRKTSNFIRKLYEIVDDPSTNSLISWSQDGKSFLVWNPAECRKYLLPQVLGVISFLSLHAYGFRIIDSHAPLEYERDDFVRGQPELLDKISESNIEKMNEYHESSVRPVQELLKKRGEQNIKDNTESFNMKRMCKRKRE